MRLHKGEKKQFFILLVCAGLFFFGLLAVFGIREYNDSGQYIMMHIHRDPGYPFFLWILRSISEEHYFIMAGILQAVISSWCSAVFTDYMADTFDLGKWLTGMVFLLTLIPHVITPLFSTSRFVMSTGIMSEALCVPLFLLFVVQMHKACVTEERKPVWLSLFLALGLSMIRAQVTAIILLWMIVLMVKAIFTGTYKKILLWLFAVCICFGTRSLLTRTYNYAFNGYFINTTYGSVNTLTNVLYAADREQGERIEDDELRNLFYLLYDTMEERQYNYKYGGDSLLERVSYLEEVHDDLKFEVCESQLRTYIRDRGITEYIPENVKADNYADEIMREIFPGCAGRWMTHYLLLGLRGAIRNIAVVHPVFSVYAIGMGVAAVALSFVLFAGDRKSKEAWLLLIAWLTVAGISYSTAFTIMCLSRYMIYGFTGFYTAALVVGNHLYKNCIQK